MAETVLGLDIGSTSLKAIFLRRGVHGGYAVQDLALAPIPQIDATGDEETDAQQEHAAVLTTLQELVSSHGFRNFRTAIAVGGADVAPRYFSFPQLHDESQIASAVTFEAAETLPFSVDDCAMDFHVYDPIPGDEGPPRTEGILIAARRHLIDNQFELAEEAGLQPVIMDATGLALTNAFIEAGGGQPPQRNVLVVNIGHKIVNLAAITPFGRAYIRDLDVGALSMTQAVAEHLGVSLQEAEMIKTGGVLGEPNSDANIATLTEAGEALLSDGCESLVEGVRETVRFFAGNNWIDDVHEMWITGGGANFPNLPEYLEQLMGVETHGWNPLQDVSLANVPAGQNPRFVDAVGPAFAIALGLAMRFED